MKYIRYYRLFLCENNGLKLLDDIYRTRTSKNNLEGIKKKLNEIKDFKDYSKVLRIFEKEKNQYISKNALSLGTKVLHTFDPERNPILDSVVRDALGLHDINEALCLEFRNAMNNFIKKNRHYFLLNKSDEFKIICDKYNLKPFFPKMKLIDMALYMK